MIDLQALTEWRRRGVSWLKVRAHIFVSGFVQGVFFRSETVRRAQQRNVAGWVRNLRDGRVEAVFEGEQKDVEALVDFCHRGPSGALVRGVEVLWEQPNGEFRGFQVRY